MDKIVRRGFISTVNPEKHTARVTFEDEDNLVSEEMPVIVPAANRNNFYALPDINDQVIVLYEQIDNQQGSGVILGSIYSEVNQPKVNSQDITRIDFDDGSFFEFDRSSGNLTIHCTGNIKVTAKRIDLN